MTVSRGPALRRPLAIVVTAAALAITGCANNANAPGTASPAPSSPKESPTPAQSQTAIRDWAKSMCLALGPAFSQLGTPPQPDFTNPAATRQAFITYLSNAANATQQAIDRLSSVGAPPVDNGQRILDQTRMQLTQLRTNLNEAISQLSQTNSNEASAVGPALSAAGNAIGLLGTFASDPQLRAAIDQTAECQTLPGMTSTTQPGSSQPPS